MSFVFKDWNDRQLQTPLLDVLKELTDRPHAAFYAPGHKRGRGISPNLATLLGDLVFKADLPELPELDNLFAPEGVIESAQQLAAAAFGAERTWFLVNGSTCGMIAAILATCGTGDKIILPRNIHTSAIAGLILSGAIPIFIDPEYHGETDLAYSITPEAVKNALKQHFNAKAAILLYPTYQGVCGDIEAIAELTHQYDIPLLVDEAHGAHFHFHPDLPISALAAGADLTVQSTHKVLGAMTQASMLHVRGDRVDRERIGKALQLLQSTSPSYLLLASLDAARQQMAVQGKDLMTKTLQLAETACDRIARIDGLSVLELPQQPTPGFHTLDRTRLTVNISQLGLSGYEADEILHQQLGVTAELPLLQHLTFIISLGNTSEDIDKLVRAFSFLTKMRRSGGAEERRSGGDARSKFSPAPLHPCTPVFPTPYTPRQAYFSPTETIAIEQAIGRISAELICPYPPGIPVLMPGEAIAAEAITYLRQVLSLGGRITGCSDPNLKTLKVIKN
jgi:arginine/lysine/ornithine decarboxylase